MRKKNSSHDKWPPNVIFFCHSPRQPCWARPRHLRPHLTWPTCWPPSATWSLGRQPPRFGLHRILINNKNGRSRDAGRWFNKCHVLNHQRMAKPWLKIAISLFVVQYSPFSYSDHLQIHISGLLLRRLYHQYYVMEVKKIPSHTQGPRNMPIWPLCNLRSNPWMWMVFARCSFSHLLRLSARWLWRASTRSWSR